MEKLVVICDSKKSEYNLKLLNKYLPISKIELFDKSNSLDLNYYKNLIFVLNASNIGNIFFINKIIQILQKRKNTKSIHFIIDGKEMLDDRELLKVEIELEKSLQDLIGNPNILTMSSNLAAIYEKYFNYGIELEEIKRDKNLIMVDKEGFQVSSKDITEEIIKSFKENSNIEQISQVLNKSIEDLEEVDIEKIYWNCIGSKGGGKSTFIDIIRKMEDSLQIEELNNEENIKENICEGIIVLLTTSEKENRVILEKVKKTMSKLKKIIIVNKTDEFMYTGKSYGEFISSTKEYIKEYFTDKIFFISSYYNNKWTSFLEENITIEQLKSDDNIVLLDDYDMPIIKFSSNKEFIYYLNKNNYAKEFEGVKKELCLNHLVR